jgi:hypothetical protein
MKRSKKKAMQREADYGEKKIYLYVEVELAVDSKSAKKIDKDNDHSLVDYEKHVTENIAAYMKKLTDDTVTVSAVDVEAEFVGFEKEVKRVEVKTDEQNREASKESSESAQ